MKLRFCKLNQLGFDHVMVVVFIVVFGAIGGTYYVLSHANPSNGSGSLELGYNNKTLCMENMDNSPVAMTTVRVAKCNTTAQAQNFSIKLVNGSSTNFQLIASASKACVDDPGGLVQTQYGAANRHYLETWPCSTSDTAQIWHWGGAGNHQLINVRSGGCINYPASDNSVGRLIVFTCAAAMNGANSNAQWYDGPNTAPSATGTTSNSGGTPSTGGSTPNVGGSQLSVGPKGSKYCLDAPTVKQGATAVLNPCSSGKASQAWNFIAAGKISGGGKTVTTYIIKNMTSGTNQCLDDWGQSLTVGDTKNPVKLYTCKTSDWGQRFLWAGDTHQLRNVASINKHSNATMCLDNAGGALKANNTVGFYTCKTSAQANQDWYKQ